MPGAAIWQLAQQRPHDAAELLSLLHEHAPAGAAAAHLSPAQAAEVRNLLLHATPCISFNAVLSVNMLMLCAGHCLQSGEGLCIKPLAHTAVLILADLQGPRGGSSGSPHLARRLPEGASAPGPASTVQKPEAHVQSGRAARGAAHEAHKKVLGAGLVDTAACSRWLMFVMVHTRSRSAEQPPPFLRLCSLGQQHCALTGYSNAVGTSLRKLPYAEP